MAVATLDHIGLSVSDYDKAKAFYTAALAPLGIGVQMEFPTPNGKAMGMGTPGAAFLWISGGGKETPRAHFAIRARSRKDIDAFHAAALKAGGKDNGAPGLRPHYHANYYAAFVLDPDGNNIEAVSHTP
ncbi:MAG: VOC family protein [Bauldia sp.]